MATSRSSHRGTGLKGPSTAMPGAASTAVLKTPGKLATEVSGSGAQTKAPLAKASPVSDTLAVTKQPGRTVVPKKTGKSA